MTVDRAGRDLASRADVEALLRRFYGRVLVDDRLAEPFADIRRSGLESHLPVMCDFWETVLWGAGLYHGSAVRAHQPAHDRHALDASHFLRWLILWHDTLDQMFVGVVAERAKIQAARVARAMHRRLTGIDSEQLDGLVFQGIPPCAAPLPAAGHERRTVSAPRRPTSVSKVAQFMPSGEACDD